MTKEDRSRWKELNLTGPFDTNIYLNAGYNRKIRRYAQKHNLSQEEAFNKLYK